MGNKHTIGFVLLVFSIGLGSISSNSLQQPTLYPFPKLTLFPTMPVDSTNLPTLEGVALGRFLFYDPILSADSTFSCASCHQQQAAFADASSSQFSTGIAGVSMRRNTMPLFNLAWYPAFQWDGKVASLEEQVFHPVRAVDEMNLDWETAQKRIQNSSFYRTKFQLAFGTQKIDSVLIAKAIGQFERTLISNQSKYDQVIAGKAYFTTDEYEGFLLMNDQTKGDCLHCHTTDADALGTTTKFSNNGLSPAYSPQGYTDQGRAEITKNNKDIGKFKIPSLRNIAITAPYMHNGQFQTLAEVLDFYSEGVHKSYNIDSKMGLAHQGGVRLTAQEKQQIIAFLHTLTDSTFLTNPAYSNPF